MQTFTISQLNDASKNGQINKILPKQKLVIGESDMIEMEDLNSLPLREHIIERLEISPGNLVLMCATGCSGKTMLAQYIAMCVGGNKKLFNTFDVKHGAVVHIDQEQNLNQTKRRYIRMANGLNIKSFSINRIQLKYRFDDPNLNLKDVENELIELCTNKVLCIIDSLKAVTCADENSSDIEVVLKMFKRVAEITNCAILCIHHKGKGKDAKQSGRGHSSIYDSADVQFDLDVNNEIYEITCAKSREGKYFDGLKYQLVDDGNYNEAQKCTEQLKFQLLQDDIKSNKLTQRDRILITLKENDQLKFNDLFSIIKGDRNKFNEILRAMIDLNQITEVPGPRNSKLYSLTEEFKNSEEWTNLNA